MLGNITLILYKVRSFRRGVADDSVILGYDAVSRDHRIPTFQENVVRSSSKVEMSVSQKNGILILVLPDAIILFPHDRLTSSSQVCLILIVPCSFFVRYSVIRVLTIVSPR
jgi:hypothetical protein